MAFSGAADSAGESFVCDMEDWPREVVSTLRATRCAWDKRNGDHLRRRRRMLKRKCTGVCSELHDFGADGAGTRGCRQAMATRSFGQ